MPTIAQATIGYDVLVEHATLKLLSLEKGRTAYGVHLRGWIDDRWIEAYRIERRQSHALSRFELDPSIGTVWFGSDPGIGPADVIDALDMLDALVARVNERAACAVT